MDAPRNLKNCFFPTHSSRLAFDLFRAGGAGAQFGSRVSAQSGTKYKAAVVRGDALVFAEVEGENIAGRGHCGVRGPESSPFGTSVNWGPC
jgi:hypothetical protein